MHKTTSTRAAGGTWTASCSCGWASPGWAMWSDAEAMTGEHLADTVDTLIDNDLRES